MAKVKLKRYKLRTSADAEKINGLHVGDIVKRQYFDGKNVISTLMYVEEVGVDIIKTPDGDKRSNYFVGSVLYGDAPKAGELFEFARVTNLIDPSRSGAMYLTSNDSNSPYMDVIDGITTDSAIFAPSVVGSGGFESTNTSTEISILNDKADRHRVARYLNKSSSSGIGLTHSSDKKHTGVWFLSFKISASRNTSGAVKISNEKSIDINETIDVTTKHKAFFFPITTDDIGSVGRDIEISCADLKLRGDYFDISDLVIVDLSTLNNLSSSSKTRIGKLDGINDSVFGNIHGYGAYFKNLYAVDGANIAGTLTAGDKFGNDVGFYAGRIHTNSFINSIDIRFKNDSQKILSEKLFEIGKVYAINNGFTSSLIGQSEEWSLKNKNKEFCFSIYVMSKSESSVSIGIFDSLYKFEVSSTDGWTRIHCPFIVGGGEVVVKISGDNLVFSAPQIEEGEVPTLYQPTDSVLNYSGGFGAWFIKGGIGGTIQNPLLKLNDDGSIESQGSGFKINSNGTGHLAGGAITFTEGRVNVSFNDSNIGEEIKNETDRLDGKIDSEVDRLETNFEIKEGQISSSVEKIESIHKDVVNKHGDVVEMKDSVSQAKTSVEQTADSVSSMASEVEINYGKVTEETVKSAKNAKEAQEKADLAKIEAENAKKSAGESSQSYLDAKAKAEEAQNEANRAKSEADKAALVEANVTEKYTEINQTADEISTTASKVSVDASNASKSATEASSNAKKASEKAIEAENKAAKAAEEAAAALDSADKSSQSYLDAKAKSEAAAKEAANAKAEAAKAQGSADEAAETLVDISSKQTEINQTAEEISSKATMVEGLAASASKDAESAQLKAKEAASKAAEAQLKAKEALESAGASSAEYKKAKAEAEKAVAEADKAADSAVEANAALGKVIEAETNVTQTAEEINITASKVSVDAATATKKAAEAKNEADKASLEAIEATKKAEEALASAGASSAEYKKALAEANKAKAQAELAASKANEANSHLENVKKLESSVSITAEGVSVNAVKVSESVEHVDGAVIEAQESATSAASKAAEAELKANLAQDEAEKALNSAGESSASYLKAKAEADKAAADALKAKNDAAKAASEASNAKNTQKEITIKYNEINETAEGISIITGEVKKAANEATEAANKAQAQSSAAKLEAEKANADALKAKSQADAALASAGKSSQSYLDAKAKADEAAKKASDASAKATQAANEAKRAEQEAIKALNAQKDVSNKYTEINKTADEIKLLASKAETHANKAVEAEASINLKADGIVMQASQKAADKAIDDLEIGGRNYLKESDLTSDAKILANGSILDFSKTSAGVFNLFSGLRFEKGTYIYHIIMKKPAGDTVASIRFFKNGVTVSYYGRHQEVDGEWNRIEIPFEVTDESDKYGSQIYNHSFTDDFATTVEVMHPMIEKGNKPTDWSPAPEDLATVEETKAEFKVLSDKIESNVKAIEKQGGTINRHQTQITQNAKNIESKASASSVDTLTKRVTSSESKITQNANEIKGLVKKTDYDKNNQEIKDNISSISQQADKISLQVTEQDKRITGVDGRVKKTEIALEPDNIWLTVKGNTQKEIDELEIGGRNLIIRHNEREGWMINPDGKEAVLKTSSLMNSKIYLKAKDRFVFQIIKTQEKGDNYWRYAYYNDDDVVVKRYANPSRLFYQDAPAGATYMKVSYPKDGVVKLERGNKATDWTPAPEDYSTTEEIKASLKMTDKGISMIGKEIDMTGGITFSMMKDGAGNTLIQGGKVKTDKLNVVDIVAQGIRTNHIEGLTLNFTKGKIGGWAMTSSAISKNNVSLKSDGSIANGSKWALYNDGSGLLASGNIKWNSSGVVSIASAVKIGSSNLDSDVNNKINNADKNASNAIKEVGELGKEIPKRNYLYHKGGDYLLSKDFPRNINKKVTISLWGDFSKFTSSTSFVEIAIYGDIDHMITGCKYKKISNNNVVFEGGNLNVNGADPDDELVFGIVTITPYKIQSAKLEINDTPTNWAPSPEDKISIAKLDSTIIENGFIKTSLLNAKQIVTSGLTANSITTDMLQSKSVKADKIDIKSLEAVRIRTGNLDVLEGATIAGFEIGRGRIGAIVDPTESSFGNLAIYNDFFRVGGNNGYAMLGDNVIPASTGGAFNATGRIVNKTPNTDSGYGYETANYGLFIDVEGGTRNYGLRSNQPLLAKSFISDSIGFIDFGGSLYKVDFSQYSTFLIYSGKKQNVELPSIHSVASMFGMTSLPENLFGFKFTFVGMSGTSQVKLIGLLNNDGSYKDYEINKSDAIDILAYTREGILYYQVLNYRT